MKVKRTVLTLLFLFGLSLSVFAQENIFNAETQFFKAGLAYKNGNYQEAIKGYEGILERGFENGPVYYNLGNSYFKNKQLGKAIVSYERALEFIPRDGDLRSNYRYARSLAETYSSAQAGNFISKGFEKYAGHLTRDELSWILFVAGVLMGAAFLTGLFLRWPKINVLGINAVLTVIFIVHACALSSKIALRQDSAIMVAQAGANFEPSESATLHFQLVEGDKVKILKIEGEWAKVERSDKNVGWVKKGTFEQI